MAAGLAQPREVRVHLVAFGQEAEWKQVYTWLHLFFQFLSRL